MYKCALKVTKDIGEKKETLSIFPPQQHSPGKPKFLLKIKVNIAKAQTKQNP